MLNSGAKKNALNRLKEKVDTYEKQAEKVRDDSLALHTLRNSTVSNIIMACESYLSGLANAPRELEKSVGRLKVEFNSFRAVAIQMEKKANDVVVKTGGGAATGMVTGIGVGALAPSAALAIATTFGTASTGTAISALSGAAATNAALAWLGGGALAAGGGGMAAGNALLALAGPVGWAIGATSLIAASGYAWCRNKKIAAEVDEKAAQVHGEVLVLKRARTKVRNLIKLTRQHGDGVREQLRFLCSECPGDYNGFSQEQKFALGALVNNVNALSALVNHTVTVSKPKAKGTKA